MTILTPEPVTPGDTATAAPEREFTIKARTQGQMVRGRFIRHRGALIGLTALGFVVVLAYTSIGFWKIPGWWPLDFKDTGTVVNAGQPSLDLIPWIDGDGLTIGDHPFGQDQTGRDYFALTMRGTQISLMVAFVIGIVSTFLGALAGAISGYYGGKADGVIMRFTDLLLTIPILILAAVVGQAVAGGGPFFLAMVLALVIWTSLARLVRGEFLSLREKEFVEAAKAMGAKNSRIIFRHILPNAIGTIIVSATLTIAVAILLEAALSYLGFGVQPPDTSLGRLISEYQNSFSTRPWLFWWPGLFIIAIALSVNFIGDGLRDAFDPRQTRVRA
ncbi:MAG TPA: ABC transporter permease [Actinomycetes bacterium]|nr:ABC transporter permease [Actinomycetes bacterium]